jgi:hypothetical protein
MPKSREPRIRIRSNHKLSDGQSSLKVGILFQDLQVEQHKVLRHKRLLWGHWLYIAALRLEDGDLLVIATQTAPQSAICDYAQRWGIEMAYWGHAIDMQTSLCLQILGLH